MTKQQVITNYGSLSLAYIGDAVYELLVRRYLLSTGLLDNGIMHRRAKEYVSAKSQAMFLQKLTPHLTDDELGVVRRGKNVKVHSHPKNADLCDYHSATGFEALFGYLHLCGDNERIEQLFDIIVNGE